MSFSKIVFNITNDQILRLRFKYLVYIKWVMHYIEEVNFLNKKVNY